MEYIHVKELKKYNPGYTDRQHIWAKIYYSILSDDWFQGLCEIDKWRFVSLIIFEVFHKKWVALTTANIAFMGWNLKKRPKALTLQMLHTKIDSVTHDSKECTTEENRIEENRIEENRVKGRFTPPTLDDVKKYVQERKSSVDPKKFFDYFTAGKWVDSTGKPVKSWKQKIITWEQSDGRKAVPKSQRPDKEKTGCTDAEAAEYKAAAES